MSQETADEFSVSAAILVFRVSSLCHCFANASSCQLGVLRNPRHDEGLALDLEAPPIYYNKAWAATCRR